MKIFDDVIACDLWFGPPTIKNPGYSKACQTLSFQLGSWFISWRAQQVFNAQFDSGLLVQHTVHFEDVAAFINSNTRRRQYTLQTLLHSLIQIRSEDCILSDFIKIETQQATEQNQDLASKIKKSSKMKFSRIPR